MKRILFILFAFMGLLFAKNQAILIFDASGSMWGQINKVPKITIAKDTLKRVIKSWDNSIALGIMVYGHRKKGDCSDIEMVFPISKVDKKRVIDTISKISPKGKTPISRSLKLAADKLKYTEDKATVILISDGKESCDNNPCDMAKKLKREGIDFVAHVIGFNVDKTTDKELECIAKATGGEYFSAKDADSLNKALKKVVKKVSKPKPKPKPKKPKFDLEIRAKEKEGGKDVKEATHYIYKIVDGEAEDEKTNYCYSKPKKPCKIKIPTGEYLIVSTYNKFKKKSRVKVDDKNLTKLTIIMGQTGTLEIRAKERSDGKDIKAEHKLYKIVDGEAEDEKTNYCYSKPKKPCKVKIPIGEYLIVSTYNKFKKKTKIKVEPKKNTLTVIMGQTGKLKIIAREKEGGKWIKARHFIYKIVDGIPEEDDTKRCYSSKKEPCIKKLPVGEYLIVSKYNNFKKKTKVEINSSKTTTADIVMGQTGNVLASIKVNNKPSGGYIYIYDDEDYSHTANWSAIRDGEVRKLKLPAGHYYVTVKHKGKKIRKEIDIAPGKDTKVETNFYEFTIKVNCPNPNEDRVTVEVYSSDGQMVEESRLWCNRKLEIVLDKGEYRVEAKLDEVKKEAEFEVGSGATELTIDFTQN